MNNIKTHLKDILLAIFILFSLFKCTQSCNRDSKITKCEQKINTLDSNLTVNQKVIDSLNNEIKTLTTVNKEISSNNQILSDVAKESAKRATNVKIVKK